MKSKGKGVRPGLLGPVTVFLPALLRVGRGHPHLEDLVFSCNMSATFLLQALQFY